MNKDRHQLVPILHSVIMRDIVISKSAPIGADLDLTISLRSTVRHE